MTNDPISYEKTSILSKSIWGMNPILGSTTTHKYFVMYLTHAVSTPLGVQALVMVKAHHSVHVVRIDLKSEDYYTTPQTDISVDT